MEAQMEALSTKENPEHEMLTTDDHLQHTVVPAVSNHECAETKPEITEEEARGILEVIASTGKYWHNWDKLKTVLSYKLKQVLSEYPESKMASGDQSASLGEAYPELVTRLNEALLCFDEAPPFTLQRLCEIQNVQRMIWDVLGELKILLGAQTAYPNLSKLALALEKNLLVTSTIPICVDPYPQTKTQNPDEAAKPSEEETQMQSNSEQDEDQPMLGDKDDGEVIPEITEEAPINDDMAIDMESLDKIVGSSETNLTPS